MFNKETYTGQHGMCGTRTYNSWNNMKRRCLTRKEYVDKGITVCDRWNSFENFLADMGERPEGTTLERKENDKGYSPENCIWATAHDQTRNRDSNVELTFNGKTQVVTDWATELGIPKGTLYMRVRRGWSVERTLSTGTQEEVKNVI